jgi:hypothetical protein
MRRIACLVFLGFVVGCGGDSKAAGTEGGSCYPNDTCNAGLTCASHLCVNLAPLEDVLDDASPLSDMAEDRGVPDLGVRDNPAATETTGGSDTPTSLDAHDSGVDVPEAGDAVGLPVCKLGSTMWGQCILGK